MNVRTNLASTIRKLKVPGMIGKEIFEGLKKNNEKML